MKPLNRSWEQASKNEIPHLMLGYNIALCKSQRSDSAFIQRWTDRLKHFARAELKLQRLKRLRAANTTFIVSTLVLLGFSLFVTPFLPPIAFYFIVAGCFTSLLAQPLATLLTRESQGHRDALSRKFYESNHEVEHIGSTLVLKNRGNYEVVARVPVLEL